MMDFELKIFNSIHGLAGEFPWLDWVVIFLAKYALYAFLLGMFAWALARRKERVRVFLIALGAALVSRFVFTEIIRFLWPRERPYMLLGFESLISESLLNSHSFPSGHASFLFAFVTVLVVLLRLSWSSSLSLYALALAVGITRIFAGVHWPSDILGGAILGVLVVIVSVRALRAYF